MIVSTTTGIRNGWSFGVWEILENCKHREDETEQRLDEHSTTTYSLNMHAQTFWKELLFPMASSKFKSLDLFLKQVAYGSMTCANFLFMPFFLQQVALHWRFFGIANLQGLDIGGLFWEISNCFIFKIIPTFIRHPFLGLGAFK